MGNLSGKIGYGVGILVSASFAVPVIHLTPGSCFFEGGCGEREPLGLALAAIILLALGVMAGVITKVLINYTAYRQK